MRLSVVAAGAAVVVGCWLSTAAAHAQPLAPDPSQPPNGIGAEHAPRITPGWSPVQVPTPVVTTDRGAVTVTAHPYLSEAVHRIAPVPAHTAVELRGAARVRLPGVAAGHRDLVVNPYGHCVFAGPGRAPAVGRALAPVVVDTPLLQLIIAPTLY